MKNARISKTLLRLVLLSLAELAAPAANAADGNFDTSWGNGGRFQIDINSFGSDEVATLLIQPDGKLLMAGTCSDGKSPSFCAARLLPNGSYDTTYGEANHLGRTIFYPGISAVAAAALTSDGGSVLAGAYGELVKLDAAGAVVASLDTAYHIGALYDLRAMTVQADGKIVVAYTALAGARDFSITRVLADLSDLDLAFGDNGTKTIAFPGGTDDFPEAVAIQPDGKIVIVGAIQVTSSLEKVGVARLLPNGQPDDDPVLGFGDSGKATFDWGSPSGAQAVKVDRDGSLLIAGYAYGGTGPTPSSDFFVNRLTSRGGQDPSFGLICPPPFCDAGPAYIDFNNIGGLSDERAEALVVQTDGKILVSGYARRRVDDVQYFAVARLTRYGDPDTGFGSGGQTVGFYGSSGVSDIASAIAIGSGGILFAGSSQEGILAGYRFGIAKLRLDLIFSNGVE
jgi:uncharacterized delta-60 repeat protein